ncbi:hypothetical protein Dsin_026426 [Dipteronia sinensis]|uniref:Uncharacterized protein n=1 Tax=Dipteronia sinensis TaxID=43782 RepID=A0AAD9ZXV2_9ROSI|nr:hypothetical protein Dsin_026426 [Dipteronia sinensis]
MTHTYALVYTPQCLDPECKGSFQWPTSLDYMIMKSGKEKGGIIYFGKGVFGHATLYLLELF